MGHGAAVLHVDWSLPFPAPPNQFLPCGDNPAEKQRQIQYRRVLMSQCAATEVLYWDPMSGKKIPGDQRNTHFETWTGVFGFPVMGIWPGEFEPPGGVAPGSSPLHGYLFARGGEGKALCG